MYFFIYVFGYLLLLLAGVFCTVYVFYLYQYTFWKRNGVKGPKPKFPEGNFTGTLARTKQVFETVHEFYQIYKEEKYFGLYNLFVPTLVVKDLEMVQKIMIKDYEYFSSHGTCQDYEFEPLSDHLFNQTGEHWKTNRSKMSPIFTPGKLKQMTKIMLKVQEHLDKHIKKELKISSTLDVKKVMVNYTLENIANCAFGVEAECFDGESDFKKYAMEAVLPQKFSQHVALTLSFASTKASKMLGVTPQREDMVQYYRNTIISNIEYREKHGIKRDDFLQYMMDLSNNVLSDDDGNFIANDGKHFSKNDIVCQSFFLLIAGYETSSSAASCALYEMALNPGAQERARAEVLEVLEKHGGKLSYESLQDMKYLGMVVEETLRLHPALSALSRQCTKDYKLDDKFVIKKGTRLLIPSYSLQMDSKYHDDPEKFVPERFSPEKKSNIMKCTYMPFGDGPRVCLGMRFGTVQVKLALATIISQYKVSPCKMTQIPMQVDPVAFNTMPKGEVYLEFTSL